MANFKLICDSVSEDDNFGSVVTVEKPDVDYLGDLPDLLLQFLQATGYTYVDSVIITTKDGKEFASL